MKNKEISFILASHKKHKVNVYLGSCIFCDEKCYGTGKQFDGWEAKKYKPIGIKKIIAGECLNLVTELLTNELDKLHKNRMN